MSKLWTDSMLAEWRSQIPADWPDWRRDYYEMTRRQNCPTYGEERLRLRREVRHLCIDQIRKAAVVPGWLTEKGQVRMREEIAKRRREHSRLLVEAD